MISVWEVAAAAEAFGSQRTRFSVCSSQRRTRRVHGASLASEPEGLPAVDVNTAVAGGDHCAELATTAAAHACTVSDVGLARCSRDVAGCRVSDHEAEAGVDGRGIRLGDNEPTG
jgi:hypothetical protein